MDYLISFLGGLSCKVYDDLSDNNLFRNDTFKESLKGTQWIILTLLSHNDFNFACIAMILNLANCLFNISEWNHPYETSLLILYPFIVLYSFPTRTSINFFELFYLVFMLCSMIWDPVVITEEYSFRKFIQRGVIFVISIIASLIALYLNMSMTFIKLCMYSIGYFLASFIFQLYMLVQNNDKLLQTVVLHS